KLASAGNNNNSESPSTKISPFEKNKLLFVESKNLSKKSKSLEFNLVYFSRKGYATLLFIKIIFLGSIDATRLVLCEVSINRSEEHTSELQSRFDLVCR